MAERPLQPFAERLHAGFSQRRALMAFRSAPAPKRRYGFTAPALSTS